jgi:hypothetical protein
MRSDQFFLFHKKAFGPEFPFMPFSGPPSYLCSRMNLSLVGNPALRLAIQRNLVSFPSQVPALIRGADDLHERIACLYFARGWPLRHICARYSLSKAMAHRAVSEWRIRAIAAGYIQEICPEDPAFPAETEHDAENDAVQIPAVSSGVVVTAGGLMAMRAGAR